MTDAWRSTHAAALVFCHSVVDAAAYGCCRITAVVDQKSWEDGVLDRKVSLRDLRSSSIEAMVSVIVERRVSELEGDSLLKKIDVLYERCKPPTKWAFSPSYSFDRERLGRIDDLRHRIVHEDGFNEIAPDAPKQVNYLVLTGYHLFHLIKLRYGLNLPPMFEEKQETSLTI